MQISCQSLLIHAEIFVVSKYEADLFRSMFQVLIYGVKRFQMKFTALEDLNLIPEYYDSEFLMGIVNSSR